MDDDKKREYHKNYKRRQRAAKKDEVLEEAEKLLERYYKVDYDVTSLQDTGNIINLLLEQILVVRADKSLDTVTRGRTLAYMCKTAVDLRSNSLLEQEVLEIKQEIMRLRSG